MAGHSKWNNIRIKKGRVDVKRGKLFTKLSREILVAGKDGADPETNFRLKVAIVRAKKDNLPANNIERLLKKLAGKDGANDIEEVSYEGYGSGGIAVLVEAATDNRNRTASDVRLAFGKNNGSIGENGCVSWLFDRRGQLLVPRTVVDEEQLFLAATEAGALDVQEEEGTNFFSVITEASLLHAVRVGLADADIPVEDAGFIQIPQTRIAPSEEDAINTLRLTDALDGLDDVQQVTSNIELSDELLARIEDKV